VGDARATSFFVFYTRFAKQTDLSSVPDCQIEAFTAPLSSVITDKRYDTKAALATARRRAG